MGAFFGGIALSWGKWLADRVAAMIIRQVGDKDKLEILCEAIDARCDAADKISPEAGKATREVLLAFADKLSENLTEAD